MQNVASLIVVACLLSLPASSFAQNADPFANPFEGDPFGGGKTKPPAAKAPNTKNVAQPKAATAKTTAKAKSIPARDSSAAILRIRAALNDKTTHSFVDAPLEEAVQQISQSHDIPIFVDRRALEEIGLTPDTPVNLTLKEVTLRSFLRLMLRELDLTYMIKDEVLQITTVEAAEQNLVIEMYRFPEELTEKADKILKALTSSVEPAAWEVTGGFCSVTAIDNVLIVSATEAIHEEVIEFLQKLQRAFETPKAKN